MGQPWTHTSVGICTAAHLPRQDQWISGQSSGCHISFQRLCTEIAYTATQLWFCIHSTAAAHTQSLALCQRSRQLQYQGPRTLYTTSISHTDVRTYIHMPCKEQQQEVTYCWPPTVRTSQTYVHTYHTYVCTYIHTHIHTYLCMYIHTHMHTYVCTTQYCFQYQCYAHL